MDVVPFTNVEQVNKIFGVIREKDDFIEESLRSAVWFCNNVIEASSLISIRTSFSGLVGILFKEDNYVYDMFFQENGEVCYRYFEGVKNVETINDFFQLSDKLIVSDEIVTMTMEEAIVSFAQKSQCRKC